MCGIAAVLRLADRPVPPGVIRRMLAAIAHRGPDGEGVYADDDIHLGAVRLAILDPAHGAQPVYGCREIACVLNGEIYNHAALRAELGAHEIDGHCDTSLLPHLYEEHGDGFIRRLRGMFAALVWDKQRRRLLLARDRLGIKPMFHAATSDFLLVASEPKAIFASGLIERRIDRESIDDLFSLGYPCAPRTMFERVRELRPAHTLVVENRRVGPPTRYWRAPFPERGRHRAASADELLAWLREATALHRQADARVGACVSGGIDSSLVAALASGPGGRLPTFSIRFPDDDAFDESSHAHTVNDHIRAEAHTIEMTRDAASLLPTMIHHLELPLLMPGAIGGLLLAAEQRARGVRVALTGDGADELFGGYDVFRAAKVRRSLDRRGVRALRPLLFHAAARKPRGMGARIARAIRQERAIARRFGVFPPWYPSWLLLDVERAALLAPDGRAVRPIDEPPSGFRALLPENLAALDPFDADIALELETRLPSWILVISDRSFMAHGVEARVPFLDHEVVERVCALPPSQKMSGLTEKALLRRAARGVLPRTITGRRKQPFMTPIAPWFFGADAPRYVDEALSPAALDGAGLFTPEIVAALRARLAESPPGHVDRLRLELVLMLVLGVQLLAHM